MYAYTFVCACSLFQNYTEIAMIGIQRIVRVCQENASTSYTHSAGSAMIHLKDYPHLNMDVDTDKHIYIYVHLCTFVPNYKSMTKICKLL